MAQTKEKTKKVTPSIQSRGGTAVVKKYGKGHMKELVEKRWKNHRRKSA